MALQVEIDGDVVADNTLHVLPDHVILDSSPAYPTATLTLRNTGVSTVTVTAATWELWSRRLSLSGLPALPFNINAGATVSATISGTGYGPLDSEWRAGCPFGRLTLTSGLGTKWVEVAVRIRLETDTPVAFPDITAFANRWAVDLHVFSNAGPSGPNPFGFNPTNILADGHLAAWATAYKADVFDAGQKIIVLHTPWGSQQGSEPYPFDGYLVWREYIEANGGTDTWFETLDLLDAAGVRYLVYTGNNRENPLFIDPILDNDVNAFCDRAFGSVGHLFARENCTLCFDSPYRDEDAPDNPEITTGEPRYEYLRLVQRLMTERGRKVYIEPRPTVAATQWHQAAGFGYIMVDRAYWRTNSDWYSTTGASNAQLGDDFIRIQTEGSVNIFPYMIADTIRDGHACCLFLGRDWYRAADRTLQQLYDDSKAAFDASYGVIS